jgi:hypothetical protein
MNLAVEDLDLVGDGNDVSFNSKWFSKGKAEHM